MIITRASKGAPLTHAEMDANWGAVAEKDNTALTSTLKVNTDALMVNSNKRVSIGSSNDSGGSSLMVVGISGVSYTGAEMNTNPASLYISNPQTTVADAGAHLILTAAGTTGAAGAARVSVVRTGDGSGALTFGTRNTSAMSEKMRVTPQGTALINTTTDPGYTSKLHVAGGMSFDNVNNGNPRVLDWYEEGAFTPVVIGGTTAGVGTYSNRFGTFTRIGNRVLFNLKIEWTAHTGTGVIRIEGLPYPSAEGGTSAFACAASNLAFPGQLVAALAAGSAILDIDSFASNAGIAGVTLDTSATLYITGTYKV